MLFDKFADRTLQLDDHIVMALMIRAPDMATFYVPDAKGYTDYPALAG